MAKVGHDWPLNAAFVSEKNRSRHHVIRRMALALDVFCGNPWSSIWARDRLPTHVGFAQHALTTSILNHFTWPEGIAGERRAKHFGQLWGLGFRFQGLGFVVWGLGKYARAGYAPSSSIIQMWEVASPGRPRRLEFPPQATHRNILGLGLPPQPLFKGRSFFAFLHGNFRKAYTASEYRTFVSLNKKFRK